MNTAISLSTLAVLSLVTWCGRQVTADEPAGEPQAAVQVVTDSDNPLAELASRASAPATARIGPAPQANMQPSTVWLEKSGHRTPAGPIPAVPVRMQAFLAAAPAPTQVLCKIQIIDDPQRNLESFSRLRSGGQFVGESESLLSALMILQKNKLTRVHAATHIVFVVGRPANVNLDHALPPDENGDGKIETVQLEISAQHWSNKLRFSLKTRLGEGEQSRELRTNADIGAGQTLVARCDASGRPLYVVLTPEIVDPITPEERLAFAQPQPPVPYPTTAGPAIWPTPVQAGWSSPPQFSPQAAPAPYDAPAISVLPPHAAAVATATATTTVSDRPANTPAQFRYTIDILDDNSGSLAEFVAANGESPVEIMDSKAIQAAIQVLCKHNLVTRQSRPRMIAASGTPAKFQVGSESPGKEGIADGFAAEVLGRERNGGIAIVFTLRQFTNGKEAKFSLDTTMPTGQSVIMIIGERQPAKASGTDVVAADGEANRAGPVPVYVVLTPERLPIKDFPLSAAVMPIKPPSDGSIGVHRAPTQSPIPYVHREQNVDFSTIVESAIEYPDIEPTQYVTPTAHPASTQPANTGAALFRATQATPPIASGPHPQIKFNLAVVEDRSGSLAEFLQRKDRLPFATADSATMQAALKALENQNLIKQISSPKIIAADGEHATLEVGSETADELPFDGLKFDLLGRAQRSGFMVDFKMLRVNGLRKTEVAMQILLAQSQCVVVNVTDRPRVDVTASGANADAAKVPVYVILTPELVQ